MWFLINYFVIIKLTTNYTFFSTLFETDSYLSNSNKNRIRVEILLPVLFPTQTLFVSFCTAYINYLTPCPLQNTFLIYVFPGTKNKTENNYDPRTDWHFTAHLKYTKNQNYYFIHYIHRSTRCLYDSYWNLLHL